MNGVELAQNFLKEIDSMSPELFEPNTPVGRGEKILLTLEDPTARKLYALAQMYRRDEHHMKTDLQFLKDNEERDDIYNKAVIAEEHADALMAFFWFLLRSLYPADISTSIGLRKGWKVVQISNQQTTLAQMLRELM